jgi:hypothetical protein
VQDDPRRHDYNLDEWCETRPFLGAIYRYQQRKRSICQDRLRTITRNTQNKWRFVYRVDKFITAAVNLQVRIRKKNASDFALPFG